MKLKYSIIAFIFIVALSAWAAFHVPQYIVSNLIKYGFITWSLDLSPAEFHPVITTLDLIRSLIVFFVAPAIFIAACMRESTPKLANLGKVPGVLFLLVSLFILIFGKRFFGFDLIPISSLYGTDFTVFYFVAFTIAIAPIIEEFFYRGFLFEALSFLKLPIIVALSTVLFTLSHYDQANSRELIWLFVLGGVLGCVRARSEGLLWSSLLHSVNNALAFNWGG